ncbi:hypothetical protein SAMN05421813_10913 [Daejeonella rubra]|uniref:Uncharacterized protein n=1 Tax=Daejeonella rubra TaxID=990371 RepID=A0A1G9S048_9SPHI|nr:hypothetical protein [Daejeonella rubra]SDM28784.1 hypothetical protein SAMN05421813_10913 [Daejeonella rubra]
MNIYLNFAIVIIYIAVFVWQFSLINTLKSKLETLERFQNIFDIKKIEEYVALMDSKLEAEKEVIKLSKIDNEIKARVDYHMATIPQELKDKYHELFAYLMLKVEECPQESRPLFLELFPLNSDDLVKAVHLFQQQTGAKKGS